MTLDPNDPDDVRTGRSRQKLQARQAQADLGWVLSDPRGQRVLTGLMDACGVRALSFVPGDPLATAFNEGKRSIGLLLAQMIENPAVT